MIHVSLILKHIVIILYVEREFIRTFTLCLLSLNTIASK